MCVFDFGSVIFGVFFISCFFLFSGDQFGEVVRVETFVEHLYFLLLLFIWLLIFCYLLYNFKESCFLFFKLCISCYEIDWPMIFEFEFYSISDSIF